MSWLVHLWVVKDQQIYVGNCDYTRVKPCWILLFLKVYNIIVPSWLLHDLNRIFIVCNRSKFGLIWKSVVLHSLFWNELSPAPKYWKYNWNLESFALQVLVRERFSLLKQLFSGNPCIRPATWAAWFPVHGKWSIKSYQSADGLVVVIHRHVCADYGFMLLNLIFFRMIFVISR